MPPLTLAPHGDKRNGHGGSRQRQETTTAPAAMSRQRSASFHGSGAAEQRHQLQQKQRPKTLPDLLAGARAASFRSVSPPPRGGGEATGRRTPSKVLVSVAVQRSMWPLHVMASAEWTVADLVAAAVALYVKEGRRPLLPSADPAAFGLHYSQFSLESLDPSHRCSRNDGSRNGDEERGTLIFNSMEREEYTASARSQIVRDEEWERRRSQSSDANGRPPA